MTDPIDQPEDGSAASDQPSTGAETPDLEAIVTSAVTAALEATDKRFRGFQSTIDKKLGELQDQFKTAALTPEQRVQLEEEEEAEMTQAERRELEIYRQREKFPKGVEVLTKLLRMGSLEEQLEFVEGLTPAQAQQVQAALAEGAEGTEPAVPVAGEQPVPEVDRNNPARPVKPGLGAAVDGGDMSDELADAIFSEVGGKGQLAALRRPQAE